jgi:hypothetical protein
MRVAAYQTTEPCLASAILDKSSMQEAPLRHESNYFVLLVSMFHTVGQFYGVVSNFFDLLLDCEESRVLRLIKLTRCAVRFENLIICYFGIRLRHLGSYDVTVFIEKNLAFHQIYLFELTAHAQMELQL